MGYFMNKEEIEKDIIDVIASFQMDHLPVSSDIIKDAIESLEPPKEDIKLTLEKGEKAS